jgi:hypothetical protein
MRRTATHLLSSPNPAQLEMRILANHGVDKRFAFLRGRWSRAWKIFKGKARAEKEAEEKKTETAKGLGMLSGYGDSDADSEASDNDEKAGNTRPGIEADITTADKGIIGTLETTNFSADIAQEARRARAKEWAEKRRSLKEGD